MAYAQFHELSSSGAFERQLQTASSTRKKEKNNRKMRSGLEDKTAEMLRVQIDSITSVTRTMDDDDEGETETGGMKTKNLEMSETT
ncbi:unnamed protein product [Fusarium graminearum]|uniref:Chromosome 2, complete genome n=1 Tax=Gibberella zeae (strain ATCC MYA-4620 / CBS 123657 / FGSC 9075 / NRRL 31084 / PH-1) TaxID=229533 RepID=A0A098DCE3_GIBZE|nr:unnamed protein product [Fusarium graminearum]CEF76624.1 unnamed protein product [Fusarium graminearum]